tara:strand:- start:767 stop:895 length:129 start_codon:yes stop_codon:yes gene_type:complete
MVDVGKVSKRNVVEKLSTGDTVAFWNRVYNTWTQFQSKHLFN